jgi:carboxylesterase
VTAPIIPGAEPFSADGGPQGALVLHGFTGNPGSMRGVAEALAAAGCTVDLPLLPGHGTSVQDMLETGWSDWLGAADEAYQQLRARCDRVAVVGLSMGGALTLSLAAEHPEVAGIVCINAVVTAPPGMAEVVQAMLDEGTELMDGIGSDIADPDVVELAYPETPLRPLLSMFEAASAFEGRLADIRCPVLVMTSTQDHVVPPENSDVIAAGVSGPVERVTLERSYHVATQDLDKELVFARTVEFVQRVTAPT